MRTKYLCCCAIVGLLRRSFRECRAIAMKKYGVMLLLLTACQLGLISEYTGSVNQDTLIGSTWQEINSEFDGTYKRWYFQSNTNLIQSLRGAALYYSWKPYTMTGTVQPNPQNQAVFELSSSMPGGTLKQYMLVWLINEQGTTAVIQVYTTPQDIRRFLVNIKGVITSPNYKKVQKTIR